MCKQYHIIFVFLSLIYFTRHKGGGHGNPLQYSCLENPRDRGAWQPTVHKVAESGTTEATQQAWNLTISRPIHVAANGIISFLFMTQQYSLVYVYHIFFIHPSADGHLGCFCVLAVVNSAAGITGVPVSSWATISHVFFNLIFCVQPHWS